MPTYQKKYEEPRDKKLERELLEYDDVDGYEDVIWKKYIQTEEDEDDEGKNDELEMEWRRVDIALNNPPKKDKYGRLIEGELHDELTEIIDKEYGTC